MKVSNKMKWLMAAAVMMIPLAVQAQKVWPNPPDASFFMTPDTVYTRIGKSLAIRHQPELTGLVYRVQRENKPQRFELLSVNQARMAGAGFWSNPSVLAPDVRYLSLAARVNIRLTYFPDNVWGRVGAALDAFGKDLLYAMGCCLDGIQDNSVRGVCLTLIFSRAELNDPAYYDRAEAIVLYIPKPTLNLFNAHKLPVSGLFDQSELYLFQGADQIQFLLYGFLSG